MNRRDYILQAMEDQQLTGIAPMMQNIGLQQANQNSILNESNQLTAQAGQQPKSGSSIMALASALRKDKKLEEKLREEMANREMAAFNLRPATNIYNINPMDIISDE